MNQYDERIDRYYGLSLVSDKIIKKKADLSGKDSFEWHRKLVNHLIVNPDPMVVPVYRFHQITKYPEGAKEYHGNIHYEYDMKRLCTLSQDEKDMIDFMSNHFNSTRHDLSVTGEFGKTNPILHAFMSKVIKDGYYTDIHDGNFLKDEQDNYLIIDLEGFSSYPGLGKKYKW